jgi:hypothetical protein
MWMLISYRIRIAPKKLKYHFRFQPMSHLGKELREVRLKLEGGR